MTEQIQTIPSKDIKRGKRVGSGAFGTVYQGEWSGFQVAIKALHLHELNKDLKANFRHEAKVMAGLNHPAIIRLYGICTEPGNFAMLVEFMPKGDLNALLADQKQALPWNPTRWQLAIDIGAGLNYLHANKILHKDLKSHNVLIDQNLRAKIGDFGLSKIKSKTGRTFTYSGGGTLPWMAPELFEDEEIKTKAVDVYAYGVVLWEIAARKEPFVGMSPKRIMVLQLQGKREEIPKDCPKVFADVIQSCWKEDPKERPTASAALALLKNGVPFKTEAPLSNTNETKISSAFETSEQIKKTLSTKTGFSFGSEAFRKTSERYATSFKGGEPDKLWNTETGKVVKTFGQHKDAIFALCPVSTDKVASGSYDKTIKVWNLKTGQCIQTLEGHDFGVYALARLQNGHIVSGSQDKTLRIWDPEQGKCFKTLQGHREWVQTVVALPNNRVASGSSDKTIKIWDVTTSKCLQTLSGHAYGVCALTYLSNGQLASGSYDSTVKIWDLSTGKCVQTLEGHLDVVYALVQSTTGQLASASYDKTIKLWNLKTGKCTKTLKGHSDVVYALALPFIHSVYLASGSADSAIKFWDSTSGECRRTIKGHKVAVYALASLGELGVVSGSEDGKIKVWNTHGDWMCIQTIDTQKPTEISGQRNHRIDLDYSVCVKTLKIQKGYITAFKALTNNRLATAYHIQHRSYESDDRPLPRMFRRTVVSYDDVIKIWDATNGKYVLTLEGHANTIWGLIQLNHRILISAEGKRETQPNIKIWDLKSSKCILSLGDKYFRPQSPIERINEHAFAFYQSPNSIYIFDIQKRKCIMRLHVPYTITISALKLLSDGTLVSGSEGGNISIWDLTSGQCIKTFGESYQVVFPNTNKQINVFKQLENGHLVSGSSDGTIKLWDISSGSCLKKYLTDSVVSHLEVLPGEKLAYAGGQYTHILDLKGEKWLHKLSLCVNGLARLEDNTLAVANEHHGIKIWGSP